MRAEQIEHFALGLTRAVLLDEDPVGDFRIEPPFLGEIGQQMPVDLDPFIEVERLQPDGEGF
ncbi:hypothetical protein GCM10010869_38250 [Mesorhizobium tianshanense]|uniref:Uncharacterized protein n=1 Tax=Mesorhizobium tianshanense TaxID=39844 RepID=A0A562N8A5_9HYPH|nr:hypothetical protein IQ26_05399 [Mesorhizobium tianshanense]GLS38231.1 hypothetical protein GCM10010869_38250 [Mesorhizobium tianshanense]